MPRGCLRTGIATGTALCLALVAAAGAQGAIKYVEKSKTFDEANAVTASLTAKCPQDARVLGGGLSNDSGISPRVQMLDTRPADGRDRRRRPNDAWNASALVEPGDSVEITVFAICTKGRAAESLLYKSKSRQVPADQQRDVTAQCPVGSRVVSGGLSSPGSRYHAWITSIAPVDGSDAGNAPDDAFAGSLDNYAKTEEKVTAHAVCAKGGFRRRLERVAETVTTNAPVARTGVFAQCPDSTRVVGGGLFTTSGKGSAVFSASAPISVSEGDPTPDDGWSGIFENYSQAETITARAICA